MSKPTCIDLRPWAKQHRYRWRWEDGYRPGSDDDEWFVEVVCRYGHIYPRGGDTLLAYCSRGVKRHVAGLGLERHQTDGDDEVFSFPPDRLDEVAAILKPKRLRGSATITPEQLANLREGQKRLEKRRQESPETTQS